MLVDRTRENAAAETLAILRPKSTLPVALLRFCAQQPLGAFGAAVLIFAVVVAVLAPMPVWLLAP